MGPAVGHPPAVFQDYKEASVTEGRVRVGKKVKFPAEGWITVRPPRSS